jgi:hypothetical protein
MDSSTVISGVRTSMKAEKRIRRGRDVPILVPIDKSWHHGVGVCACADEEEDDE